jgi:hypothetical protein
MTFTTRRRLLMTPLGVIGAVASGAASAQPSSLLTGSAALRLMRSEPVFRPSLFQSFFLGGFECSTHWRTDGRRHDLLAATRHDVLAEQDYRQLAEHGIRSVRDGVRWHLVEAGERGKYDWSSVLPMLRAGKSGRHADHWDLCHYGWPDDLDVFSAAFVDRFERYARAFAKLHLAEIGRAPMLCPINEMSFLAWAGGDVGIMNPGTRQRGVELKRQLVRATIAATQAVRQVAPEARLMAIDPLIHLVPRRARTRDRPRPIWSCNSRLGTCSQDASSPVWAGRPNCSM